jgi:excisionase family DNA binding protein
MVPDQTEPLRRARIAGAPADRWLTLGEAAAHLGVHESTLRRWSDSGRISCRRTAGGHRRFLRSELDGAARDPAGQRRGLANGSAWQTAIELAGMIEASRTTGQRVAGVVAQFMLGSDPVHQLDQAREIGRTYGVICRIAGMDIYSSVEAYLSYRDRFLNLAGSADGDVTSVSLARFEHVLGEVLLGLVEGLQDSEADP